MNFRINYSTERSSFDYEIETESSDISSILNGVEAFLKTVLAASSEELDDEAVNEEIAELDKAKIRAAFSEMADEVIDDMYGYYGEGKL